MGLGSTVVQGKWPLLTDLKLQGDVLSLAALQGLTQGNWPRLSSIKLMLGVNNSTLVLWLVSKKTECEQKVLSHHLACRSRWHSAHFGGVRMPLVLATLQVTWPCLRCFVSHVWGSKRECKFETLALKHFLQKLKYNRHGQSTVCTFSGIQFS